MRELKVSGLSVSLKDNGQPLVDKLSFRLGAGESLILLGQSGCGKTMTCRAVMGLLEKSRFRVSGSASLDGGELLGMPEKHRAGIYGKKVAFVPQNPMTALDPSVSIGRQMDETLYLHTRLNRAQRQAQIRASLLEAGLEEPERVCRMRPNMLSGGMLQRVLIALALSTGAELVIADEPTTALDVVLRNETVDAFVRLREKGAAVLFVTHDFAAARRLGGEVLVMREGTLVERGDVREVWASPEKEYTKALVRASSLSKGARHADR